LPVQMRTLSLDRSSLCVFGLIGFFLGMASVTWAKSGSDSASPSRLPASSLADFSGTLEAPAGKHGFLKVGSAGHFYWADGRRARFWGINVSSTRLDIPPEQIEQVVGAFARAGLNMVRLEAIDNRNCLLGEANAPDSLHFDRRYLDRLDHWMASLRRHGLYYYLDLLDFRTFKTGDGVLNADSMDRGARPYALFDRYLIQLQKDYAADLLTHRNPYSGLRPVDDPALALVEICNEHGFFLYPEKLETLAEPYRSDLRIRWNHWLRDKYGTRERQEAAWGQVNNVPVLRRDEAWETLSIDVPLLTGAFVPQDPNVSDIRRAPTRVRDGIQFLVQIQRAYFREMRGHLRQIGLRVPITAVVSSDVAPDVASVAQECDFTAENWYGEGINDDPRTPGVRYYGNRNSLRDDSQGGFAPHTAALRWNNKPVVIREWATTWPNRHRAASVPEALAYASLQDYDAILLFGYQTNRAPNGADADALNDFAFQSDPTVWGLYALAGRAFLSRAIRPADHTVTLVYPPARQFAWPGHPSDMHRAAWCTRLNSILSEKMWGPYSVMPTGTFRDLQQLRDVFDRIGKRGAPLSAETVNKGVWRSDTGQIARFDHDGRLEVRTPTLCMVAGELGPGHVYTVGALRFSTPTPIGAILAFALDGLPLERSRHLVVKMVSRAENTDEVLQKTLPGLPGPWALRSPGRAPVLTFGRPAGQPCRVWIAASAGKGKTSLTSLLTLGMVDGTWELEIKNGAAQLACDTPGISGTAMGQAFTTPENTIGSAEKAEFGGTKLLLVR
jgi:hypothetical protein